MKDKKTGELVELEEIIWWIRYYLKPIEEKKVSNLLYLLTQIQHADDTYIEKIAEPFTRIMISCLCYLEEMPDLLANANKNQDGKKREM